MIIKTKAFILRIIDYKDNAKMLVLYTEKLGKVNASAFIPEKINSIVLSTYEIGNAVEIILYKKKENDIFTVSQINLIKQYPKIRFDYDKYRILNYSIQTVLTYTEEEIEDHQFMNFLKLYMNFLNDIKLVDNNITFLFDFYYLRLNGFLNELNTVSEEENYLMEHLYNQVLLDEKLFPFITKNLKKQVFNIKNKLR